MDWSTPIDAYCERTGPAFWAEPLNAATNLSFIAAAAYGLMLARRRTPIDPLVLALAVIAALVGVGSFLFHTVATRWAALADVIPIGIFIAVGFGAVMHRLVRFGPFASTGLALAFVAVSPFVSRAAAPLLGSSAGYLPALLALLGIGGWLTVRSAPNGRFVLAAGLVFCFSLALRMADEPVCASWPLGTHLGWHLLNGVVLTLVMRAVVDSRGVHPPHRVI